MIKSPLPYLKPRGNDVTGHGHYGASRGNRKHRGFDIQSIPNEDVKAPIDGYVTVADGRVYSWTNEFRYIEISNKIYRVRLMYVKPLKDLQKGQRVVVGDLIGSAQDIARQHGNRMINHVHIEVYKYGLLTDPEPILSQ